MTAPQNTGRRYYATGFWPLLFLILAIIAFVVAGCISIWSHNANAGKDSLGLIAAGLALFAASHV